MTAIKEQLEVMAGERITAKIVHSLGLPQNRSRQAFENSDEHVLAEALTRSSAFDVLPVAMFVLRPVRSSSGSTRSQKVDFLGETDHFIHALKEGLKSLVGGLELRGMDPTTREGSEGLDTRNFTQVRTLLLSSCSTRDGCLDFGTEFVNIRKLVFLRSHIAER